MNFSKILKSKYKKLLYRITMRLLKLYLRSHNATSINIYRYNYSPEEKNGYNNFFSIYNLALQIHDQRKSNNIVKKDYKFFDTFNPKGFFENDINEWKYIYFNDGEYMIEFIK